MDIKLNKRFFNEFVWKEWKRLIRIAFLYTAICIVLLILLYLGKEYILNRTYWYQEDMIYPLLHFINLNKEVLAAGLLLGGWCIILVFGYRKVLYQLDETIEAAKKISSSESGLIVMSAELKDVEREMNQTKMMLVKESAMAREAEQRKNDLVVYLAHDLKTPLTSVIGYLTLLCEEKQISQELQEKYISIALHKSERLEELINEFFEITRFNLTHISLDKTNINLSRMLEQLIFEFKPLLDAKELLYRLEVFPDVMLYCDPDKMQRVFDNLFKNAVNYSNPRSTIEISLELQQGQIKIKVLNHGKTIPEEKLGRIFEQFFRVDTARRTTTGGSGIGLAIAKEIVELHGGTITAESENDTILFQVILPQKL